MLRLYLLVKKILMENILGDRYKILNQLGSGGFGETFLAEDLQMKQSR